MPVALSSDLIPSPPPRPEAPAASADNAMPFSSGVRALMVASGLIPFLHLAASVALMTAPLTLGATYRVFLQGVAALYLAGPIVVRATTLLAPLPRGRFDINSRAFLLWWFTAQWQVVFNRLPWLEELLRMVPGLYSAWLRCWGARVGKLVYWAPGVVVLDRPLLDVGSRVVFGVGARLNGHVLAPGDHGNMVLHVGRIVIGADALVGGYCFIPAGARVAPGEIVPGMRTLRPFADWKDGRRAPAGAVDAR